MENKINTGGGNSPILKSALPILVFSLLPIPGAIAGNISSVVSSQKLAIDRKSYLRCESKK